MTQYVIQSGMSTLPRWIRRTQTVGLIVTGAAIGHYYVSPSLRVEEVSLPPNTLLAKARLFGLDGKKQVRNTEDQQPPLATLACRELSSCAFHRLPSTTFDPTKTVSRSQCQRRHSHARAKTATASILKT